MNFLEKLQAIPAQAKAIRESLQILKPNADGTFTMVHRESDERAIEAKKHQRAREAAIQRVAMFMRDLYQGRIPSQHLREAMSTSDFPMLFGDVLYRQLLGNYEVWPTTYQNYFKISEVRDFRTTNMYMIDGGGGMPLAAVAERAPYPETQFTESKTTLSVGKYGRRYGLTFEMLVNDDLNAFNDRPQVMASDARLSEEYLATTKMFDANGPDATFYSVGNDNIITGNPALSLNALQTAMTLLGNKKDSSGRPIIVTMMHLVVPPALEITAQNILAAELLRLKESGGSSNTELEVRNWMRSRLTLHVNAMIPIIVTSTSGTTRGNTSWALVASSAVNRPAFHFGFLRGYRQPQLSMRTQNHVSISGGLGPQDGSFENDSLDYRLRHIFGASQGDVKMSVASNGTGS